MNIPSQTQTQPEDSDRPQALSDTAAVLRRAAANFIGEFNDYGSPGEPEYDALSFVCDLLGGDHDVIEALLPAICQALGIDDPWPDLTHHDLNRMVAHRRRAAAQRGLRSTYCELSIDLAAKLRAARHRAWLEGAPDARRTRHDPAQGDNGSINRMRNRFETVPDTLDQDDTDTAAG